MTKGHYFVKNNKSKNSKSYAHPEIMMTHSGKLQVNLIKDVTGVAGQGTSQQGP